MKCVYPFGTGRHKRQADLTLLFQYKSKRAIDPQGSDKFAPKKLDWQGLCRVPPDIAIHTKCISCDPHGFREDFFFQYKSMGVIGPHGVASFDPRGLIGRIHVVEH